MKKYLLNFSKIINLVLSWFNFFLFFAMRCCWSGISKTLGYEKNYDPVILWLPVMVWVLFLVVFIVNIFLYFILKRDRKIWSFICNFFNVVFLVVNFVIIKLGAIDYLDYVWPEFLKYVGITILVLIIGFFIFIYPKTSLHEKKLFKGISFGLILVLFVCYIVNFSFNSLTTGPVVYAVNDEYQIVFSSKTEARAWVTIDGKRYFDNYNGSNRTYTKIHKVCIPTDILDEAKEYEVHVQKVNYRGPFGGYMGRDISSDKHSFTPVDTSDGLDYYAMSDIHMGMEASVNAASHYDYELLILAGDIVSVVDSFADVNYVNEVAYKMTKGEVAVVYARGNHEIKGKYAEELHNFVGADGENFYYNFYLDGVYGVVLDIGEDHDDDWWEYYDTAYYTEYNQKQFEFLESEIKKEEYKNYAYQLAVCHIPPVFVNSRKNHTDIKAKYTELLNKMNIDMCISGHQHDLLIFEPGVVTPNEVLKYNPLFSSKKTYKGYLTDFNFTCMTVSKRGKTQTDSASLTNMKEQIGVHIVVNFNQNNQEITFNTSNGDLVNVVNPYADINYGKSINFSLNN